MKALYFLSPGQLELREVEKPEAGPGELIVKVAYAGVCGTDVRIYRGTKAIPAPRIIGHEFSGTIAEVGPGVEGWEVGSRVTVYPVIPCGTCYACRSGRPNICLNRTTIGYELDGAFAEYVKVPREAVGQGHVIPLPPEVSLEEAAAAEPVAAAFHGIRRSRLSPGQDVCIMGAGPIGLYHLQLAFWRGARQVIVSEPQEERRNLALRFGATVAVAPEEVKAAVGEVTGGAGVDVVFIDVGIPAIIREAVSLAKKGGTCVLFAGCPAGSTAEIDPNEIHYREVDLIGSSASTPGNLATVLRLAARNFIDIKSTIGHILDLEDWARAFQMKQDYAGLKTLLKP
ncbi:alcohol dehydrogenase catalytic domain-containing protein [Thermanaeromonas sp. C210]|uniref:alcohol dehydrogenase catalytic domain-containing protein n=1 Tax=Thermanaeromonas sp. C210 TaxID=2731925 RepID=UPI00155D2DD4|nr:alcohol dehydrogenase catalytic domain-containing protein [Thermanaeromonas sp. C210]GFN22667.1 alcohol dehydrogenase [Thermanaeromonas sp. C210]